MTSNELSCQLYQINQIKLIRFDVTDINAQVFFFSSLDMSSSFSNQDAKDINAQVFIS